MSARRLHCCRSLATHLVSAGTFLAILAGTILGAEVVLTEHGIAIISGVVIAVAALGWLSSCFIPATRPAQPDLVVGYNFVTQPWKILTRAAGQRDVFLCIMGISWFWLVGATFQAWCERAPSSPCRRDPCADRPRRVRGAQAGAHLHRDDPRRRSPATPE